MKATEKYQWVMDALSQTPFTVKARAMKHFLMGKREYIPKKKTHADMDSLIKCALCPNMCRFDCPVSETEKSETASPSGRARIAYMSETGRISGEDVTDVLYKCCGCNACKQWCPFDFSLGDILKGVRQDLVEKHEAPSNAITVKDKLMKEHVMDKRTIEVKGENTGDILYFMGCSVLSDHKEIAESMIEIMKKAGDACMTLEEEWCCGVPLHNLGFLKEFKEIASHNIKEIKKSGCKTVVCSCPTCTHVFKNIYPQVGLGLNVDILHSSEYLSKIVREGKIKCSSVKKECVYHDPCTLARKLELIDEPREVLKSIPDLVVKYPYFGGKDTQCCGRGGSLGQTHSDLSEKITKKRAEELKKDAKCIVTACPTCNTAFKEQGCEVYDISELVFMGIGKKDDGHEDKEKR